MYVYFVKLPVFVCLKLYVHTYLANKSDFDVVIHHDMQIIIIISQIKSETTVNKCKFYFSCYISVQNTKVQYIAKAVVFTRREATPTVIVEALQICSYLFHSTCNSNCKFIKIQSYESEQIPHCTMYNYSVKIVSIFVHKHYYYTL